MTLSQQFLAVSILPVSFLLLVLYTLWARLVRRRLMAYWTLTLVAAGVWASSTVSYYGGAAFPDDLSYFWRVVGNHALTLLPFALLLATGEFLGISSGRSRVTKWLVGLLWLGAIALDISWPYSIPPFTVLGQTVRHFDLWGGVWATSWLLPSALSWLLSQRAVGESPSSSYRNQSQYYLLATSLIVLGSAFGLFRHLVWQQTGVFVTLLGAVTGTLALTRSQLPNLGRVARQLSGRLLEGLILFGLSWLAFFYLTQPSLRRPSGSQLALQAVLFAVLVIAAFHTANWLAGRIVRSGTSSPPVSLNRDETLAGGLLDPEALGQLVLHYVRSSVDSEDAWILLIEDGPGGLALLRPLCETDNQLPEAVTLEASSPFLDHLKRNARPLMQYDIDNLRVFEDLAPAERELIKSWQRLLYMPLHAGDRPVALLGLAGRRDGKPYDQADQDMLLELGATFSPLLVQAQNAVALRQVNDYLFQQNQRLGHDNRYLRELVKLHGRFATLVSTELRESHLAPDAPAGNIAGQDGERTQAPMTLQRFLHGLGQVARRVDEQAAFQFESLHVEEIVGQALQNLSSMAEARQVALRLDLQGELLPVCGDRHRLIEAFQRILHNAIKFSRIGGVVRVECQQNGNEIVASVIDRGVGMPDERLSRVWDNFVEIDGLREGDARGLGLALARFVVQAHGGRVAASSDYGAGSTYTIYLPASLDE